MRNIAFITYEFPPEMATGGIGSYFSHLSALLSKNGFNVHVFSATSIKENQGSVLRQHCTNHLVFAGSVDEFRHNVLTVFEKVVGQLSFHLMESPEVGACALEIKKRFPHIPLIVKLHTPGVCITKISRTYQPIGQKLRFVLGALLRGRIDLGYWSQQDKNRASDVEFQICQLAEKVLSPSEALKNWLVKYWGLDGHSILVVPNPYFFDKIISTESNYDRQKVILFVGKLTVLKGMVALTKAIPKILKKHPEFRIRLVGRDEYDGFLGSSLKEYMIKHLGVYSNRVDFLGVLDRTGVDHLFRTSSLVIFPSLWENYPTVILEALANQCPVVASNVGGIGEIVIDEYNGMLFDPLSPSKMAKKISCLIGDPQKRSLFAMNGLKTIQEMQSEGFVNHLLSVYQN
ncbi:MAG: glycosyltransferase family 4 protein [Breznakibacter sp.]